jgi:aminobenzoyl-glutamate utilization protein B
MKFFCVRKFAAVLLAFLLCAPAVQAGSETGAKREAAAIIDAQSKQIQVMVDEVFSFAEPGFQEYRTSAYLQDVLKRAGFQVTPGVGGIPTAFTATWGEGGPLIALGSDMDDLLGLSQYPGIPNLKPMVSGAPGHGEGHNAGMPLVVVAAIATKAVMQSHHIPGRLLIWPGVAEELLGAKAYYVHAGLFKNVDACIFVHVSTDFGTGYGDLGTNGMVSVEYTFHGKAAHAAMDPWDGRSALDAVEIMDNAWNYRRQFLPVTQRSHHVITNGGGQPNVVPDQASVWYYFRDRTFAQVKSLYEVGTEISEAAAKATGTTVEHHILGYAAPDFANKPLAEAAYLNIKAVGMPKWDEDDQAFARAVQETNHLKVESLASVVAPLSTPESRPPSIGGGSDDIGDIMWSVPTITVRFPSNIPNTIAHNSLAAMSMATPIAHKGVVAGAKAVAMTVLDLMVKPELIASAKDYFNNVQLKTDRYEPILDRPAVWLNEKVMAEFRSQMQPFYYDPSKYPTYLDQLGIRWPTLAPVK